MARPGSQYEKTDTHHITDTLEQNSNAPQQVAALVLTDLPKDSALEDTT